MPNSHCRIGKIRLKASGCEIQALPSRTYEGHNATIVDHARQISDMNPEMDGFFVLGWQKDASYSIGWRNNGAIPARLFPSWIAEIVRDEMITEDTANFVISRAFDG